MGNWSSTTGTLSSIVIAGEAISLGCDGELLLHSMRYPNYTSTLTHDERHLTTQQSLEWSVRVAWPLSSRQKVFRRS